MNFIKSLMIVVMSFMMVISSCQKGDNLTIDIKVEKLISQMTLEEKIGQAKLEEAITVCLFVERT